jgi:hypothetical protein
MSAILSISQKAFLLCFLFIDEFRKMLRHCGSDGLEKTSKIHNLKLNGEFKTCEQCAITKAKQKNLNKD